MGYDLEKSLDEKLQNISIKDKFSDLKNAYMSIVKDQEENHLLIEDFTIESEICAYFVNNKKDIIFKEENPSKTSNTFKHYIRTETFVSSKEAPSVKNSRIRRLIDVDAMFLGNPHAKVKRFDECI